MTYSANDPLTIGVFLRNMINLSNVWNRFERVHDEVNQKGADAVLRLPPLRVTVKGFQFYEPQRDSHNYRKALYIRRVIARPEDRPVFFYWGKIDERGNVSGIPNNIFRNLITQEEVEQLRAINALRPDEWKDEAIQYGRNTGICSCCGRTLTNPESIANGIGPVCAENWGFA